MKLILHNNCDYIALYILGHLLAFFKNLSTLENYKNMSRAELVNTTVLECKILIKTEGELLFKNIELILGNSIFYNREAVITLDRNLERNGVLQS